MTSKGKNTDLKTPLVDKEAEEAFPVDVQVLVDLFHPYNTKKKDNEPVYPSLRVFKEDLGGYQGIAQRLSTDLTRGISNLDQNKQLRINKFGENKKRMPAIRSVWEMIAECFEDRILQILILAAIVAIIVGTIQHPDHGWIEGTSIFFAILIIVGVTVGNDYVKEKQFQKLVAKANEDTCTVIRDGESIIVSTDEIYVGDIYLLSQGMKLPADSLLLQGVDIQADESSLTGEPDELPKFQITEENYDSCPNPFLMGKTMLTKGQGKALVLCVGSNTFAGKVEEKLQIQDEATPLQQKLEVIANVIGKIGMYVALFTFILMSIRNSIDILETEHPEDEDVTMLFVDAFVKNIIIAITVIVVAVPEGLPLAVTISLAFSVMKMKEQNNLVRKLHASETMGGADQICTDKTGTLTVNRMTVQKLWSEDTVIEAHEIDRVQNKDLLAQAILYNCSVVIDNQGKPQGNVTEKGIINHILRMNVNAKEYLSKKTEETVLTQIPFNSKRKRATAVLLHPDVSDTVRVFCKGAPEIVLNYVGRYIDQSGAVQPLDQAKKQSLVNDVVIGEFANNALRTILVTYKDYTVAEYEQLKAENNNFEGEKDREVLENDLIAVGIFALEDPLRDEIVGAIQDCHKAGIKVRMVTGDNIATAKAIAVKAGIIQAHEKADPDICMEGQTFRERVGGLDTINENGKEKEVISDVHEFKEFKDKLMVLARSTPEDKYLLVTGLRNEGSVVAVTGDGTNDAPALKRADVGFSMGITGTEVAKEASEIVLLDDNFSSMVTAVKWGRNIYANVRKFLQFQLTVNVVAMFIVFSGGAAFGDAPLTSVQMLWVNLIMDTFAALALATEPPSDDILNAKPYSKYEDIVTTTMWRNIFGQGLFQIIVLIVMLIWGNDILDIRPTAGDNVDAQGKLVCNWEDFYNADMVPTCKTTKFTMIFNAFVFMQVFNEINSRKLGEREFNVFAGFFNNWLFTAIIIGTIAVQIVLVEFGGLPVRCTPLDAEHHIICLVIGALSLVVGVFVKFIPARLFKFMKIYTKDEDAAIQKGAVNMLRKSLTISMKKKMEAQHRQSYGLN